MSVKMRKHRKTRKSSSRRHTHRNRKTCMNRRHKKMSGGNYARDVTTRTLEGTPMKPLHKVVTTVPGRGTMSAAAYVKMMEEIDRNGNKEYA